MYSRNFTVKLKAVQVLWKNKPHWGAVLLYWTIIFSENMRCETFFFFFLIFVCRWAVKESVWSLYRKVGISLCQWPHTCPEWRPPSGLMAALATRPSLSTTRKARSFRHWCSTSARLWSTTRGRWWSNTLQRIPWLRRTKAVWYQWRKQEGVSSSWPRRMTLTGTASPTWTRWWHDSSITEKTTLSVFPTLERDISWSRLMGRTAPPVFTVWWVNRFCGEVSPGLTLQLKSTCGRRSRSSSRITWAVSFALMLNCRYIWSPFIQPHIQPSICLLYPLPPALRITGVLEP